MPLGTQQKPQMSTTTPKNLILAYIKKPLCVKHYLAKYIARTNPLRPAIGKKGGGGNSLFVTSVPPHTPIRRATLTSWVRTGLSLSRVDTTNFTPHSTRSAATSKAKRSSVPLTTIYKTAGWRISTTLARFYDKQLENKGWSMADLDC